MHVRIRHNAYSRQGDVVLGVIFLNKFVVVVKERDSVCREKQVRATSLTFLFYAVVSCIKRLRFAAVLIRLTARQTLSSSAALRHGLALVPRRQAARGREKVSRAETVDEQTDCASPSSDPLGPLCASNSLQ